MLCVVAGDGQLNANEIVSRVSLAFLDSIVYYTKCAFIPEEEGIAPIYELYLEDQVGGEEYTLYLWEVWPKLCLWLSLCEQRKYIAVV